ncbi:MAG TPA: beta-ketoacyl-ACP synthase III [Planctomycetota bacterium]|nr:beta-ketoacyl-ACP synthase III [Planctomycetota bacterium]
MNVYITNLAAFMPGPPVSNDDMEQILGQVGERPSRARRTVLRSNGIQSRHYAIDRETRRPTHTNAQLAAEAVRRLAKPTFSVDKIDCLACGTSIADQVMPSHVSMVHGELAIPPCETISAAGVCLASLSAMKYAAMGVGAGEFQRAVACGSELSSGMMRAALFHEELEAKTTALESNPEIAFDKDFLRWMLSDGAGAALLEPKPAPDGLSLRIDWIWQRSYAGEMQACMYAGAEKQADGRLKGWQTFESRQWLDLSLFSVKQDIKLLNEHIMRYTVERGITDVRAVHPMQPGDIDWFLPHYSSNFFRERVHASLQRAGFEIPMERWFTNLSSKGNTGAASIYIILEELFRSGKLKAGERLLCYVPESGRFATGFMHLTVVSAKSG